MSRSYKKPYATWTSNHSMKRWRTQENRRLRHNAKLLINNCDDWDSVIIPILNDYDTLWGSPQDGKKRLCKAPYLNQCEVDAHERRMNWGYCSPSYELVNGHHRICNCYSNKRKAYYWKLSRK